MQRLAVQVFPFSLSPLIHVLSMSLLLPTLNYSRLAPSASNAAHAFDSARRCLLLTAGRVRLINSVTKLLKRSAIS